MAGWLEFGDCGVTRPRNATRPWAWGPDHIAITSVTRRDQRSRADHKRHVRKRGRHVTRRSQASRAGRKASRAAERRRVTRDHRVRGAQPAVDKRHAKAAHVYEIFPNW